MGTYNDSEHKRDYPEVQFTLAGDEGKSPEQLEKEIEQIIKLRDLYEKLDELGWSETDSENTAAVAAKVHAKHVEEIRRLEAQLASERAEAEKERAEIEARHARNLEAEKRMEEQHAHMRAEVETKIAEMEVLLAKHAAMLDRMSSRPQDDAK